MNRRVRSALFVLTAATVLGVLAVGCGDEEAGDDGTTTSAADAAELRTCEEVYPSDRASTAGPEDVEARGAPTMEACDPGGEELLVIDQVTGTGAEVTEGGTVTAHYRGISADTGEEFDSSWNRGQPATFPLDGVIDGWSTGLVGMKEGGRRVLVIPAAQAYGDNPPPGSGIAPGATLVFTVDLVSAS